MHISGACFSTYLWDLISFNKHILIQYVPLFLSKIANKRRKQKMGSEIQIVGAGFLSYYTMLLSWI